MITFVVLYSRFCTLEWDPVCGDTGDRLVTYSNICNLQVDACNLNRDIVVVLDDVCPEGAFHHV